jgi:hypothetical protein
VCGKGREHRRVASSVGQFQEQCGKPVDESLARRLHGRHVEVVVFELGVVTERLRIERREAVRARAAHRIATEAVLRKDQHAFERAHDDADRRERALVERREQHVRAGAAVEDLARRELTAVHDDHEIVARAALRLVASAAG